MLPPRPDLYRSQHLNPCVPQEGFRPGAVRSPNAQAVSAAPYLSNGGRAGDDGTDVIFFEKFLRFQCVGHGGKHEDPIHVFSFASFFLPVFPFSLVLPSLKVYAPFFRWLKKSYPGGKKSCLCKNVAF